MLVERPPFSSSIAGGKLEWGSKRPAKAEKSTGEALRDVRTEKQMRDPLNELASGHRQVVYSGMRGEREREREREKGNRDDCDFIHEG